MLNLIYWYIGIKIAVFYLFLFVFKFLMGTESHFYYSRLSTGSKQKNSKPNCPNIICN